MQAMYCSEERIGKPNGPTACTGTQLCQKSTADTGGIASAKSQMRVAKKSRSGEYRGAAAAPGEREAGEAQHLRDRRALERLLRAPDHHAQFQTQLWSNSETL